MDGFIGGREIVSGVRAELSSLKTGQRVAFGRNQIEALAECPPNVMRLPPQSLLPGWLSLHGSFRLEYVAGFIRDLAPRDMSQWLLMQAAKLNSEAATLFEKAGAKLVGDVIVPEGVMDEVARRKARAPDR